MKNETIKKQIKNNDKPGEKRDFLSILVNILTIAGLLYTVLFILNQIGLFSTTSFLGKIDFRLSLYFYYIGVLFITALVRLVVSNNRSAIYLLITSIIVYGVAKLMGSTVLGYTQMHSNFYIMASIFLYLLPQIFSQNGKRQRVFAILLLVAFVLLVTTLFQRPQSISPNYYPEGIDGPFVPQIEFDPSKDHKIN